MAQTQTRTASRPDDPPRAKPEPSTGRAHKRAAPRFWYLPLLLAVMLPLALWLAANGAFAIVAVRDLGPAPQTTAALTSADQPILTAVTALVQSTACQPGSDGIGEQAPYVGEQAPYVGAEWSARRSAANPRAYYVAASDQTTGRLIGIWQVEGGQVLRLQDDRCTGLPAASAANLAEAAILFSSLESESIQGGN